MRTTALVQYYGSNRMNAHRVGELLEGCSWVGIPFAGGMCEIPHIQARTIVANDLHEGVYTLAMCVRIVPIGMQNELRSRLFHPATLRAAQRRFFRAKEHNYSATEKYPARLMALDYFTICWMTRAGTAGTPAEQTAGLSLRWEAGGGDSMVRWNSAIDSLQDWAEEFKRCSFACLDAFDFLERCKDQPRHGLYCDPPFFGVPGKKYLHNAGSSEDEQIAWHKRLASVLGEYRETRVVVRAYDVPFVREHYRDWVWHEFEGRKQTNAIAPELLLVRN